MYVCMYVCMYVVDDWRADWRSNQGQGLLRIRSLPDLEDNFSLEKIAATCTGSIPVQSYIFMSTVCSIMVVVVRPVLTVFRSG